MFRAGLVLPWFTLALCLSLLPPSFTYAKEQKEHGNQGTPQATILISNKSHHDLVGIRFVEGDAVSLSRLDLGPGDEEELENPGGEVTLRLDLGLSLCSWPKLNIDSLRTLQVCAEHEGCVILEDQNGNSRHVQGSCQSLIAKPGDRPVCMLDRFRPGMTMQDACGLININYRSDDNAYLTSLGFAGIVWSARLYASERQENMPLGSEKLENIELRHKLTPENLSAVIKTLHEQKYVPWQALFPGLDINFMEMPEYNLDLQRELLEHCMRLFLLHGRGAASIMFAPSDLLPYMATADFPRQDMQLFTVLLHRDADTLILDLATYSSEEMR